MPVAPQSPRVLEHLALSRSVLDRDGAGRADPRTVERALSQAATRVLELAGDRARAHRAGGTTHLRLRSPAVGDADGLVLYLGKDPGGTAYLAVLSAAGQGHAGDVAGQAWSSLREIGADLDELEVGVLTSAVALAQWHARHLRCPLCGGATVPEQGGWQRRCVVDDSVHHPRTDPAVIVAVLDEDERILLGRGPTWPPGRLSVLAGFVEPGESLEAAVVREVHEEVGVTVTDLHYRGNQPWPFPASLMVGFTAQATGTSLTLDPSEISEAHWLSRSELARAVGAGEIGLPTPVSIARRLIEDWYGGPLLPAAEVTGPFRGADAQ